ncbi:hypothetical protein V6S19_14305 [Klebsiella pneumoniae]
MGRVFYSSIDIRKSESLKGRISISTAFDWMKRLSLARRSNERNRS